MINGRTEIIAHLGYPTETFTAPMIYNPWFAARGINAVVVPMGVRADDYAGFLGPLFRLSNIRGALVTMPHKLATVGLIDEAAVAVRVAGACNAILCRPDGSLYGDLFDGIGFVRGAKRKGFDFAGADCLIVGAGGVGSAIAASIAAEGPGSIALCDIDAAAAERLAARLRRHFPGLVVMLRDNDPAGYRLVDYVRHGFPMGRLGTVDEVADVIVFAASPRAHWINGRNIPVDGLEQPHAPLDRRPY